MDKKTSDYLIEHEDYLNWNMNLGDKTIHARQVSGRFRTIKWLISSIFLLPFLLAPYLTWDERQAVLYDIPARKFYFFNIVVWPQDLIILALLMLFAFILLFAMTAIAGRVFCGFMCPQTLWTDLMTLTERWAEGKATQRMKLDAMPWNLEKIRKKLFKHSMWATICLVTSVTFLGYFSGIYSAWESLFTLNFNVYEWASIILVFALFYVNAGFLREQVCQWMCPYSRIQAVMTDKDTVTTTYDHHRGEKRARLKRGEIAEGSGDCIDCNLCVSVCPTGVDIRDGNQIGCINCGICIDACDDIMEKVNRPKGLIRFMSYHELEHNTEVKNRFLRPRPIIYMVATTATFIAIFYSLVFKSDIDMHVNHERSPTFTMMSDRSVQNMYHLIIMNKTESSADFTLNILGLDGATSNYSKKPIHLTSGQARKIDLLIKMPQKKLTSASKQIELKLESTVDPSIHTTNKTVFFGPAK